MILAFIAIAGLLLSNKDTQQQLLKFINKHNNWLERSLASTQTEHLATFNHERDLNIISQSNGPATTVKSPTKTVIEITNAPPIETITTTTTTTTTAAAAAAQYAWKSVIDKIKAANSNKNSNFVAINDGNARRQAWSTVMARIRATTTTMAAPAMTTPPTTTSTSILSAKTVANGIQQPQQQPPVFVRQEIGKLYGTLSFFFVSNPLVLVS